jgi:hypothetical protein
VEGFRGIFLQIEQAMRKLLPVATIFALALSASGCSLFKSNPQVDPNIGNIEDIQLVANFVPNTFMTRHAVEDVIGEPVHFGHTKIGNLICMYQFEGVESPRITDAHYQTAYGKGYGAKRSVVYDRDNNVVSWYGFDRKFTVVPGTSEPAED